MAERGLNSQRANSYYITTNFKISNLNENPSFPGDCRGNILIKGATVGKEGGGRYLIFYFIFLFNYKARDNTNKKSQFTM